MDKASIITVFGTAALGLIKSKMGSGVRLAVKKYVYLTETYAFNSYNNADVFNVKLAIEMIQNLELMIKGYGFELVSIEAYPWLNDNVQLNVKIRKLIETEQDLQHYINESRPNWEVGPGNELGDFFENTIEPLLCTAFWNPISVGHDYEFGYEKVTINADTGEEYKPKMKSSKLRRR